MSSPGFISLSAITVLASPRPIDPQKGIRNIVFDANFFIVDGSQTSTLGLLRYFVPEDMLSVIQTFSESNFQKAFINANISSISPDTFSNTLISDDLQISDYAFVGDIIQLTLMDDITNTNVAPYISVTGSVTNVCQSDHSFDMSPSQYIALPRCSSPFPIHGHFIESKRWGEGKSPKMFVGSTVAFGGFVDRIKRERDKDYTVCAVNVEVVNLAFITTSSTSQFLQNRPSTHLSTSHSRWNYQSPTVVKPINVPPPTNNIPSPAINAPPPEQAESSKTQGKRKRIESSNENLTLSDNDSVKNN